MRRSHSVTRASSLVLVCCLFWACWADGSRDSGPTDAEPTTGSIRVNIATIGPDPDSWDPDGYTVVWSGGSKSLQTAAGSVFILNLEAGRSYSIELTGVADNCHVMGDNPVDVHVRAGRLSSVNFGVWCDALLRFS